MLFYSYFKYIIMNVNLLKDEFNSKENFLKLLTPRIYNNKRAFERILYPEKKNAPLPREILKRTRIITKLKNEIERIYVQNEDYFTKIKEFNINKNTSPHSTEKNTKNKLKKKNISSSAIYESNKSYLENSHNKKLSNNINNIYPFLKSTTKLKIVDRKINLSPPREDDYDNKLNKIKASLSALKENKNIINRNGLSNLSSLTDINAKNNFFLSEKKVIKKTISSTVLSEKSINFKKESRQNNLNVLKPSKSNITFSNCITSYTEKNNKDKKYLRNKISSKENNYKFNNKILFDSNKNIDNLSYSKKKVYNNYNYIFSEQNASNKKFLNSDSKNNNFSNSIIKINKIKLLNRNKICNPNNLKNATNNFTNHFNKKLISLNDNMHLNNKVLTSLIEAINKEINRTKAINLNEDESLKEELDIRKDILYNENEKNYLSKKGEAILKDDENNKNRYKINPKNNEQFQSFNLLKSHINSISEQEALRIIEKLVDKKQREKLDVKKLLEDYYNKKIEKEMIQIAEVRKKAERNYKKMLKMKYNL